MADVTFVHSSAGYQELMKSGAMVGVLQEHASGIHGAATGALSADKGSALGKEPYAMRQFTGRDRAGVRIQTNNPHARNAEAKHGHLQNAAGV